MSVGFESFDHFLKNGRTHLSDAHYSRVWDEIRSIGLGAEIILAGFHDNDSLIVRLDATGEVHWEDGYSVIGSGMDIALAFLCQNSYDEDIPLHKCVFRVYEAKSAAQKNRTVGTITSFELLIQGKGRFDISNKFFKYLKTKRRMLKVPEIEIEDGWLEPYEKSEPAPITTDLGARPASQVGEAISFEGSAPDVSS